jgi:uncharacterized protein YjbI with pentapeptide repeats
MVTRSSVAKQLKAYYPEELLAMYSRGERDFAAANLLRRELEASFAASRGFAQAENRADERPTSPLWLDHLFRGDPDFEFDRSGRIVSLEIDDLPETRDLSKADLREIRLEGGYLYPVDFSAANLSGANLRRAIFIDCSFQDADLSRTDLRDASFDACDFRGANFYMARMDRCSITDAQATRTRFERAKLKKAIFAGVDLRRAELWAHYDRTIFAGCDLREASFDDLDFRHGVFYENVIGASQITGLLAALRIDVDPKA